VTRENRSERRSSLLTITCVATTVCRARAVRRAAMVEQHCREWPLALRPPEQCVESELAALHDDGIRVTEALVQRVRRYGKQSDDGDCEHGTLNGVAA